MDVIEQLLQVPRLSMNVWQTPSEAVVTLTSSTAGTATELFSSAGICYQYYQCYLYCMSYFSFKVVFYQFNITNQVRKGAFKRGLVRGWFAGAEQNLKTFEDFGHGRRTN